MLNGIQYKGPEFVQHLSSGYHVFGKRDPPGSHWSPYRSTFRHPLPTCTTSSAGGDANTNSFTFSPLISTPPALILRTASLTDSHSPIRASNLSTRTPPSTETPSGSATV